MDLPKELPKGIQALRDLAVRRGQRAEKSLPTVSASPPSVDLPTNAAPPEWRKWSPLHEAAQTGNLSAVSDLLEKKADRNVADCWGRTALHVAARDGKLDVVKRLLEPVGSMNLDACDVNGQTALHLAALHGRTPEIKELLAAKASLNPRTGMRSTPLDLARDFNQIEAAKMLKTAGGNPSEWKFYKRPVRAPAKQSESFRRSTPSVTR